MPFTLAHPAAVLPLRRLAPGLPLAAAAAGAVAPDVEYLLRLAPRGTFGHSPPGLLLFCVPVGLALWLAWTRLVVPAVRGGDAGRRGDASLLAAAAAVLSGAMTHVVWDAFTHATGAGVAAFPALARPVAPGWPAYRILQHASTLVGGAFVLRLALPSLLAFHRTASTEMRGRMLRAVIATVVAGLAMAVVAAAPAVDGRPAVLLGRLVVGALAGGVLGLVTWAAAARIGARRRG
jgi:hypothetical protein